MVSSRELPLHQEIELYTDPNPAYAEVLRFLGLPAWRPSSFVNQSDPLGKRCRAAMSETTRKRLTEEFERYNRTLADLIGSHSRGADSDRRRDIYYGGVRVRLCGPVNTGDRRAADLRFGWGLV